LRNQENAVLAVYRQMRTVTAHLRTFVDGMEVELSCPRCLNVVRQPQVLSPCGLTVCRSCLREDDDQRSGTLLAAGGDGHRVGGRQDCGCPFHEGAAPNRAAEALALRWADLRAAVDQLEGSVVELAPMIERHCAFGTSVTARAIDGLSDDAVIAKARVQVQAIDFSPIKARH
jgi:hypothetical protein